MAANHFRTWYEAALIQSAADSYLDGISLSDVDQLRQQLLSGNNDLRPTVLVNGVPTVNQLFAPGSPFADATPETSILPGATRMTPGQVQDFLARFELIHAVSNDASGFSAILVRDRTNGEFFLSFRSTEFPPQDRGGDRERDYPAGLNIGLQGYALAQLSAMEDYYARLRTAINPATGQPYLPVLSTLNVVGYSLGGHLATVFTERHVSEVRHAYLFNAAGRGALAPGWDEARLLNAYNRLLANPLASVGVIPPIGPIQQVKLLAALRSGSVPANLPNIYAHPRHQWAVAVLDQVTSGTLTVSLGLPGARPIHPLAASKMTYLHGIGSHEDDSFVAASGVIPEQQRRFVFIEDQPNGYGNAGFEFLGGHWYEGDFYRTHSITLVADSLALMDVFKQASQGLTQLEIESIFAASSNEYAVGGADVSKVKVEAGSLENALDALYRVLIPGVPHTRTPVGEGPEGFGHLANRAAYHARVTEIGEAITIAGTSPYAIRPLATMRWVPSGAIPFRLVSAEAISDRFDAAGISGFAPQNTDEGLAYRYALRAQIPFAVIGAPYSMADREALRLFDPTTGAGNVTARWIEDRTEMLRVHLGRNIADKAYLPSGTSDSVVHRDLSNELSAYALSSSAAAFVDKSREAVKNQDTAAAQAFIREEQGGRARYVLFGVDGDATKNADTREGGKDTLVGADLNDRLYGGAGDDVLRSRLGDDYLEGGAGADVLRAGIAGSPLTSGATDNDTLVGGKGNDVLSGDAGVDKYYFYTGDGADAVFDFAEGAAGAKKQLGEIYFGGANGDVRVEGIFTSLDADQKTFNRNIGGDEYFATYQGDVATATPGRLILFKGSDGSRVVTLNNFVSGDFDIVLDPNAPPRQYTQIFGTAQADNDNLLAVPPSLASTAADQQVFGLGGADFIKVRHANAQAYGGVGNDYAIDGADDQQLYGDQGRDVLVASAGDDSLYGGADGDALQGGEDNDYLDGSDGSDVLDGGAGADVIIGGGGNDFVLGGGSLTTVIFDWAAFADGTYDWGAFDAAGDVLIRGLVGDSNVEGDEADVITAGGGDDWVFAGAGDDAISGGLGDDYLVGQAGHDEISADEGADLLYGDGAQGDLSEVPGNFTVFTPPELHGKDMLDGGDGDDFVSGDGEADELFGGDGNDTLVGDSDRVDEQYHGADYLDGGAGNDLLLGYGKDDTLAGGPGNDTLGGDSSSIADALHGDDYLDGEDGADTLHGDGGDDTLFGGAGNDTLDGDTSNVAFEFHGDDYLEGGDGVDALLGGGGSDRLFGGAGNDSLVGDAAETPALYAGDDYLDGEAGDDVLEGGEGKDTLAGGTGSDILRGQAGDDVYLVNVGDQSDFIQDSDGINTVRFGAGIGSNPSVFQSLTPEGKAYLGISYSGGTAFIEDGLTNNALRYEFADGKVKTAADWRAVFNQPAFTFGTAGDDTFAGSGLADSFFPGAGNDTILFGRGSGFDTVTGFGQVAGDVQGIDRIVLGAGIAPSDLQFTYDGVVLRIMIRVTGERLQVVNWAGDTPGVHGGLQVQFAAGGGLTAGQLVALALTPTDGGDVLVGSAPGETISGAGGNDNIQGGGGSDALFGGEGDDTLNGGTGADAIDGGSGNDSLSGGAGADVYLFGAGDGNDVVTDDAADVNVVQFKAGITPADVTVTQGSIVVTLNATGETLTLNNWHGFTPSPNAQFPISEFRFADGTVWDASVINENANHATPFADLLRGIYTDDRLYGLGGNDELRGDAGDDVLSGGDGNDVLFGDTGADELDGGAGDDTLQGGTGGDVLRGGPGNDSLAGESGDDLFIVGDGSDSVLEGSASSDEGSWDVVRFEGIGADQVRVLSDPHGLLLVAASGATVLLSGAGGVHGIEQVVFADGTSWTAQDLSARIETPPVVLTGGDQNDTLTGGAADDTLDGGGGNDTLSGMAGADTLRGGAGGDQLSGGDGADLLLGGEGNDSLDGFAGDDALDGGPGNDQLRGGPGNDSYRLAAGGGQDVVLDSGPFIGPDGLPAPTIGDLNAITVDAALALSDVAVSRSGADLVVALADGSASVRVASWFANDFGPQPLVVRFADGNEWNAPTLVAMSGQMVATEAEDVLYGGAGADTFTALAGNDTVGGNGGDDVLRGGDGNDTLFGGLGDDLLDGGAGNDNLAGGYGNDVYVFGYGYGNDAIQEPTGQVNSGGDQAAAGERDVIRFSPEVRPTDVVIEFDQFNRPTLRLLGSADTLTFTSWGNAALGRVEYAEFADGSLWDLGKFSHWRTGTSAGPQVPDVVIGSKRHFPAASGGSAIMGIHDELFLGQSLADSVTDLDGHATFYGGGAADTFTTAGGDDDLAGGAGNDTLSPGTGDNVIRFGRGAGQDTLALPSLTLAVNRGLTTVVLGQDTQPSDVVVRRGPSASLILGLTGTPDTLTVNGPVRALDGRDQFRLAFADGTSWGAGEIEAHIQTVSLIQGGTGINNLVGGDGDDWFIGGPGGDTLTGGAGNDRFQFFRGDGVDTIVDEAPRIVLGQGIRPQDVALSGSNFALGQRDLVITMAGGDGIVARNWFPATHAGAIEFADGTVWDSTFVGTRVPFTFVSSGGFGNYTGTSGNDVFSMGATPDHMSGGAGNDTLSSDGGNDELFGGAGDDTLSGGAGGDNLHGDAGDDRLFGGTGGDSLQGGDGDDLLDAGVDVLGAGETDNDGLSGGSGNDILVGRLGGDILNGNAGDDSLDAGDGADTLSGGTGQDVLDGGAGDDVLEGGAGDDSLDGGPGDDKLYGGTGSDVYHFRIGSGRDTLLDFDTAADAVDTVQIAAGIAPEDITVLQDGASLVLRIGTGTDRLTVRTLGRAGHGVERVTFHDGTVWDAAYLRSASVLPAARGRADLMFGTDANDALAGLGGDDTLIGGAGDDTLDGGSGDDVLEGGEGRDTLDGGPGFDHLTGGSGGDTFVVTAGSGSDAIADFGAPDKLAFGSGISAAEVSISRDRDHLYLEARPTGQLITLENWFASGAQGTIAFADGTLWNGAFLKASVDALTEGEDFFVGTEGAETISSFAGFDTVHAGAGDDTVIGGADSDTVHGEAGGDLLFGESGYDVLSGGDGNDTLDGGADDDQLQGGAGDDVLVGGEGFDALFGGTGNDVLDGGTGNDTLEGGLGSDLYRFSAGFGSDTVNDGAPADNASVDVARFTGVSPASLSFAWIGNDFTMSVAGSDDALSLPGLFFSQSIERFEFDDGSSWGQAEVLARTVRHGTAGNDILSGTLSGLLGLGGNDTLFGSGGDNLLDGGTGNDTLQGGGGNDTYVFGIGYGEDRITNVDFSAGRFDVIAFSAGIRPQDVVVGRSGTDLLLTLKDTTDRVRITNWYGGSEFHINEVRFADGTAITAAALEASVARPPATSGNDVLFGTTGPDTIDGLGGNDTIDGDAGADILSGGAGNDTLRGGTGGDVYRFGFGAGFDTVIESDSNTASIDVVSVEALPSQVTVSRSGTNVLLTLVGGLDRLTLQSWFVAPADRVEQVRFSDGTVWDIDIISILANGGSLVPTPATQGPDTIVGTPRADIMDGLGGNDSLNGGAGNDTYRFAPGYGNDTITDFDATAGNVDTVELAAPAGDTTLRRAGANLEVRLASGDVLTVLGWFTSTAQQVERIRLADGTVWDVPAIDAMANAGFTYTGSAASDNISASGGPDILIGGAGNDTLQGGAGDDIYRYAPGDGSDNISDSGGIDAVEFGAGIASADVVLTRLANALVLSVAGGQVALADWYAASGSRVESVRFADGTVWNEDFLLNATRFSEASDFVRGTGTDDVLEARGADDTVYAGPGNDRVMGAGGDDVLAGEAGADTLDGGSGRDILDGGDGDDVYVFDAGYGDDWVIDSQGADAVAFGPGLTTTGVVFTRDLANLYATAGADRLSLVDWFHRADQRVETFRYADATVFDEAEIRRRIRPALGTPADDTIFGSDLGDTISGQGGEDALYGEGGDDTLDGGPGSDYLLGGQGNDTYRVDNLLDRVTEGAGDGEDTVLASVSYVLAANVENLTLSGFAAIDGTGNSDDNLIIGNPGANVLKGAGGDDSMHGGTGNDAYVLDRADGIAEVVDFDPSAGNHDQVRFAAGIAPNDVRVARLDNDIRLRVSRGGQAYLRNWFDPEYRIESIRFADGTVWDEAMIEFRSTLPDNQPPVVSQPMVDRTVLEDSAFDLAVTAFSDPDAGDVLTYAAALADGSALPGWLSFDAATATFGGTPANDDVGTMDITVTATDPSAESVSDTFRLEVLNSNDAPLAGDDSGAAQEDGPPVTLTAALLLANDRDIDAGDSLSIVGTSDSAAGASVSLVNGNVVYDVGRSLQSLGEGAAGTDTFTYTVADAAGATARAIVTMSVAGSNDSPQLATALPDRAGREGEALTFALPAGAFEDPDFGDALAYSAEPLPAWLHFDAVTGTFGGTPGFADSGTYELHVVATDRAGASASGAFRLTIEEVCNDGEIHAGGKHDDVLVGCACDDVLLGFGGDDALFGEGGDDVLRGDKGKDFLAGGAGNDLLDGGHGSDFLDGGAGTNLLIGGKGADALVAHGVNDIIAWNPGDGPDEVTVAASEAANRLTLSFGRGLGERDIGFKRRGEALEVSASDDALTLENWYALAPGERPTLTVQIIGERVRRYEPGPMVNALQDGKHADGAWRATGIVAADPATGDHLVIGGAPAYDYAVHGSGDSDAEADLAALNSAAFGDPQNVSASPDEHCRRDHEGEDHGRDADEDDEGRPDFVSFWIERRLSAMPRFDFEALLADMARQAPLPDRHEIARRWIIVARHAHALAGEHDDERYGAPSGGPGSGPAIGFALDSAGFGYEGSIGASVRPAHTLEPLRGLTDGFRQL